MRETDQHRCDVCGRSFETLEQLEEHGRQAHEASTSHHECRECGVQFATAQQYEKHAREMH